MTRSTKKIEILVDEKKPFDWLKLVKGITITNSLVVIMICGLVTFIYMHFSLPADNAKIDIINNQNIEFRINQKILQKESSDHGYKLEAIAAHEVILIDNQNKQDVKIDKLTNMIIDLSIKFNTKVSQGYTKQ